MLWTFHKKDPLIPPSLVVQLIPGIDRGRVLLYSGVDCNSVLPKLAEAWLARSAPTAASIPSRSNPVQISTALQETISAVMSENACSKATMRIDHLSSISALAEKNDYAFSIPTKEDRVMFVTGIGGQGKSTKSVAKYFAEAQSHRSFEYFLWRDCKEEGERFENQIASVIETLSGGVISGSFLAKQSIEMLVEILSSRINDLSVLFVFDNVDHYVNFERTTHFRCRRICEGNSGFFNQI